MNVTMTLDEFYDLQKRAMLKANAANIEEAIKKAAYQFIGSLGSKGDAKRSLDAFLTEVRTALNVPQPDKGQPQPAEAMQ